MRKMRSIVCMLIAMVMVIVAMPAIETKAEAIQTLTLNANDTWVDGAIVDKGGNKYYQITLDKAGWLTVTYQGLGIGYSHFSVMDKDAKTYYDYRNDISSSEVNPKTVYINLALEAGKYIVKIESSYYNANVNGKYRIKAAFTPANNNEQEPNDTFDAAMKLQNNQEVTGFISEDDKNDFYKFEVSAKKRVKFVFNSETKIYIKVWDQEKICIKSTDLNGSNTIATYVYEEVLDPGTYYIHVYRGYTGRYNLKCSEEEVAQSVSITGAREVADGQSVQLQAVVGPANVTNKTVTWASKDTNVASVDSETGKVSALNAGVTTITATTMDGTNITAEYQIVVKPGKMDAPTLYKKKRKLTVQYRKVANGSGYEIQYGTKSNFSVAKIVSKAAKMDYSSYDTKTLKSLAKKKYYVRVRAYYTYNGTKYYGSWSKKSSAKVK